MAKANKQDAANTVFKPTSNRRAEMNQAADSAFKALVFVMIFLVLLTNNDLRDLRGLHCHSVLYLHHKAGVFQGEALNVRRRFSQRSGNTADPKEQYL